MILRVLGNTCHGPGDPSPKVRDDGMGRVASFLRHSERREDLLHDTPRSPEYINN